MELKSDTANDLITVVIPFYKTDKNLFFRCISSILVEGALNVEAIIVDDGSGLEYHDFLESFTRDQRVRVIFNEHKGVSAARNTGLRAACGRWIAFVDSDDYVDTRTWKRILDDQSVFKDDVVLFGGGRDRYGTVRLHTTFLKEQYNYGKKNEDKLRIMESALTAGSLPRGYYQSFSLGSPCSKLYDVDFLRAHKLQFDEEVAFSEDVLFLIQVYAQAGSIHYYDWPLYIYVNNVQSSTKKYRPGLSEDMKVFFRKMEDVLKKQGLYDALEVPFFIRAEIEGTRSMILEFMNPQNTDPNRYRKYRAFIRQEPFRTAFRRRYLRPGIRGWVYYFLMSHGHSRVIVFFKRHRGKGGRRIWGK